MTSQIKYWVLKVLYEKWMYIWSIIHTYNFPRAVEPKLQAFIGADNNRTGDMWCPIHDHSTTQRTQNILQWATEIGKGEGQWITFIVQVSKSSGYFFHVMILGVATHFCSVSSSCENLVKHHVHILESQMQILFSLYCWWPFLFGFKYCPRRVYKSWLVQRESHPYPFFLHPQLWLLNAYG